MGESKIKKLDSARSLKDLIEELAGKTDSTGKSYHQAIVRQLLKSAASGSQWAILEYFNRIAGKSVNLQQTDITSNGKALNASVTFVNTTPKLNEGHTDTIQSIEPIVDKVIGGASECPE